MIQSSNNKKPEELTLVDRLRRIEDDPQYTRKDKPKAYWRILEEWRRINSLVNKVIRGKTTFSAEVYNFIKQYSKWSKAKEFVPYYINADGRRYRRELSEVCGWIPYKISTTLFANPFSLSAIGYVLDLLILRRIMKMGDSIIDEIFDKEPSTRELSRREFFHYVGQGGGFLAGLIASYLKFPSLDLLDNANYVDLKIKEVYPERK